MTNMTTLEEKLNALEALNLAAAQDSMGGAAAGKTWLVAPLHTVTVWHTTFNIVICLFVFVYLFVYYFICHTVMMIQPC